MATIQYVWDAINDCVVLERVSGMTRLVYTSEPKKAGPLISHNDNGTERYYAADGQHNVRALSDVGQNVSDRYTYSYFGVPIESAGSSYNPAKYYGEIGYLTDDDTNEVLGRTQVYAPHTGRVLSRLFLSRRYRAFPGMYLLAVLWQDQNDENGEEQQDYPPQAPPFGPPGRPSWDEEDGVMWLCCSPLVPPEPPFCHLYIRIIIPSPEPDIIPPNDIGYRGGPDLGTQMANYGCDCQLPWGMVYAQSGDFRPPFPDADGPHPCVRLESGQLDLRNIDRCFQQTIERINRCCIQYDPYGFEGTCNSNCVAYWLLRLCIPGVNWNIPTPPHLGVPFGWGGPVPDCVAGDENENENPTNRSNTGQMPIR